MALRELLAVFGVKVQGGADVAKVDKQLTQAKGSAQNFESALGGLQTAFAAMGAAMAIGQIKQWVEEVAGAADAAADTADALGVTIEQWQALQAFGETAGGADMKGVLRTLASNAEAAHKDFAKLGVSLKDAEGNLRPMADIAEDTFAGLADLSSATERVAMANNLLGRSGNLLVPSLKDGSDAMREAMKTARELGVIFDDETGGSAGKLNDQMYFMRLQTLNLKAAFVQFFFPMIQGVTDWLTRSQMAASKWVKGFASVSSNMTAVGVTGGVALAAVAIGKWSAIAKGVGQVANAAKFLTGRFALLLIAFFVIQDFIVFLRGGDSLIGTLLEDAGLIDNARTSGVALAGMLKSDLVPALRDAGAALAGFARDGLVLFGALVNAVFDSHLREEFLTLAFANNSVADAMSWVGERWYWLSTLLLQGIGQIIGMTTGGWADAIRVVGEMLGAGPITDGLNQVAALVEQIGGTIRTLITDPIGAAANFVSGQGLDGKAGAREASAFANDLSRVAATTNVTVNVASPPGASAGGLGRTIASAVSGVAGRGMRAALAAVSK